MIKIEFNGSGEEVRNEMLRLLGLQEPKVQSEGVKEEKREEVPVQPTPGKGRRPRRAKKAISVVAAAWTEKEAETLLKQIKPNAKNIMVELAHKPEGYGIGELALALGLQESAVRGQMSSVGFALKRMGGKPSPIKREKIDGELTYKLDSVVAGLAKQQSG
jgi:hypothetical protein